MISGLLEQRQGQEPDIHGQEMRIGHCWNAPTLASPARGGR